MAGNIYHTKGDGQVSFRKDMSMRSDLFFPTSQPAILEEMQAELDTKNKELAAKDKAAFDKELAEEREKLAAKDKELAELRKKLVEYENGQRF